MDELPQDLLIRLEQGAVELARLAAAEITNTLGQMLSVEYKTIGVDAQPARDPVSEVDRKVEVLVRARLADAFPGHDVLGEESEDRPARESEFVWAIDPVDGTTNFVNGFPLFAASIGVLHRQVPVAGAIWCSTSHELRGGVYHARLGGPLQFEGVAIERRANPAVRRHLAGEPVATRPQDAPWDVRKTGSAALEAAFVAAGLLRVARFGAPNVWDVAAGIVLVRASRGEVAERRTDGWERFEAFEPVTAAEAHPADLRHWRRSVILGEPEAVALMAERVG